MPETRTLGNTLRTTGIGRTSASNFREVTSQPTFEPTLESPRSIPIRQPISNDRTSVIRSIASPTEVQTPSSAIPSVPQFNNPFEILADAFTRGFGNAQYNPPLQSQAYGYTPVGGTNWGIILLLLGVGAGIFFYFRSKS